MPRSAWKALSAAERDAQKAQNVRSMEGRGLCSTCYHEHRDEYDRVNRPLADVLEDWDDLANPLVPVRREVRRLAGRLGMKEKTLEKIVTMHVGSRFQAGHGEILKQSA